MQQIVQISTNMKPKEGCKNGSLGNYLNDSNWICLENKEIEFLSPKMQKGHMSLHLVSHLVDVRNKEAHLVPISTKCNAKCGFICSICSTSLFFKQIQKNQLSK